MALIMAGFLVMIPLSNNLGCGGATSATGQLDKEIARYQAAVKADPKDVASWRSLAENYMLRANVQPQGSAAQEADWRTAAQHYRRAVGQGVDRRQLEQDHTHADAVVQHGRWAVSDLFSVSSERAGDGLGIVALSGEVDIYTAPQFKECMLELLDAGVDRLVVDLSGVTFIDSTALGVLIGGVRRVHSADGAMALVVTSRAVERVLSITGLDRVFTIHATRAAALESLA